MESGRKGKVAHILQAISIIPLILFGIAIILLGNHWFTKTMHEEVAAELIASAKEAVTLFDVAYPGDYHLEGETSFRLYKGEYDLTGDYTLVDRFKENTGLDITLFYQDTRILTTLCNTKGERIIGTGAPQVIMSNVFETGDPRFYANAYVNNSEYFACYLPIRNSDDTVVGMMFVGKPSEQVNTAVQRSVYPLLIADILAMIVIAVCIFIYTKRLISILLLIRSFMAEVSSGNLTAELNPTVLKRRDEFGDIGRSAIAMQQSLRKMIEQDGLTELFNRRFGDRKLKQIALKSARQGTPFSVAIGDIDFFKKVNDTYGHECGDLVLKKVAEQLRSHMSTCGFVARWGGEEFLLVFDHFDPDAAHRVLEKLLNDIRAMEIFYDNRVVKVTMTFGLVGGGSEDAHDLVRQADEKLYEGKTSGRNRIIY